MKIDYTQLTPMMKQYFDIKNEYKEFILFYRLGDFYEMFFEDAVTAARELELTLTARNAGLEEKAPLCGVPYHSAENYIVKLIEKGYKVAICEQTEDPALAKGLVKREVVRVITPGTITDPSMLNEKNNNYLLSLHLSQNEAAITYSDISTFEMKATYFTGEDYQDKALDEIIKIMPGELLLPEEGVPNRVLETLEKIPTYITRLPKRYYEDGQDRHILSYFNVPALEGLGLFPGHPVTHSLGAIIEYIRETQRLGESSLNKLEVYHSGSFMLLDRSTVINLELFSTIRNKDKKGSLNWVLDKTSTAMGSRRLKKWMTQPLLDAEKIAHRHNMVEALLLQDMYRDDIQHQLRKIYDLERLVSKLVYGSISPRDFLALGNSLRTLPFIKKSLVAMKESSLMDLAKELQDHEELLALIDRTIDPEPPIILKDGGYIRHDFNEEIAELDYIVNHGEDILVKIELEEREKTGIKNLKVKFNKVFGYFIEVTNSQLDLVPDHYVRKQTLSNAERYITEELKALEQKILSAKDKIVILEQEIFLQFKEKVQVYSRELLESSKIISELDVLVSFALVAKRNHYVRPQVTKQETISIKEGRHPVVEKLMAQESFVTNDTLLDHDAHQFYIITGPNMAGKSTFLRQVALITLMAQIGSFVPAAAAEIGIVDRIFTRVGASDDLTQGQSTFMVEMSELANILKNASHQSLVILDEIGRGTSTYDGLSIAWAVVEYLTKGQHRPKTLFATHYHELTELEGRLDGVKNFNISVKEAGDDIIFLRKIVRGGANQSYGIQVAKLAGVPKEVIDNARLILSELEESDINRQVKIRTPEQLSFISTLEETLTKEIKEIAIDELTPLEALLKLSELQKMVKS